MIHRTFRYRLTPTAEQEVGLERAAGAVRFVYNLALEQRQTFSRQGRNINCAAQCREIKDLRQQCDWLKACHCTTLHNALRDLDSAFQAFFRGSAAFPKFRRRGVNDSFRFRGQDTTTKRLNRKWSAIRIPKIGWVKFRDTRSTQGQCANVTVSLRSGAWFVAFTCARDLDVTPSDLPAVGIDRGVATTVVLSTGEMLSTPATERFQERMKRAHRAIARSRIGSNRRRAKVHRMRRIMARLANVRADWRHKTTLDIARRFGVAVLEDLKTAAMTKAGPGKRGLNRSILAQGWRAFETTLAYKMEERGGKVIKIDPRYTSQSCSECGVIDSRSRESQARFACVECGFSANADQNAAVNILRRGTASMRVEERGYSSGETRTANHALAA